MTHAEAVLKIEEGKRVRRASWDQGIYLDKALCRAIYNEELPHPSADKPMDMVLADDWEEVKE